MEKRVYENSKFFRQLLPPMSPWSYGWMRTAHLENRDAGLVPNPSERELTILKNLIIESHASDIILEDADLFNKTVEGAINLVRNNPALYDFLMETDSAAAYAMEQITGLKVAKKAIYESDFFIPWRVNSVPRAECLEFAYGIARDFTGKMRKIPKIDISFYLSMADPMFGSIVDRGEKTVEWLNREKPERIVFAPAGMIPELRHFGFTPDADQKILLVDKDVTINYGKLLADLPFRKNNFSYIYTDIADLLKNIWPAIIGTNAFVMVGFATYIWDTALENILLSLRRLMNPNGFLIMDVNATHFVLERNKAVSFYLPMKTFATLEEATESLFKKLQAAGIPTKNVESATFTDVNGLPTSFHFLIPMS
ncbi:hypothetical protein IKF63_02150 [Candidatus Saccharibacteria bacterium]|nr:hypothetical protein [Candidatus Saccharibacteria bacterium]